MRKTIVFLAFLGVSLAIHLALENPKVSNEYCVILDANISGTIKYWDDKTSQLQSYDWVINKTSTTVVSGECSNYTYQSQPAQKMNISFFPNDVRVPPDTWNLVLYFGQKNKQSNSFKIIDYSLEVVYYDYFNVSAISSTYNKSDKAQLDWSAEATHGFSCNSTYLKFMNDSTVKFDSLKILAFTNLNSTDFPKNHTFEDCKATQPAHKTADIVPIITGLCLTGLVVTVLIAYLIGRARDRNVGYSSV